MKQLLPLHKNGLRSIPSLTELAPTVSQFLDFNVTEIDLDF